MARVQVNPGAPYLVTEDGLPWTPIGHGDAIARPDLSALFRRRDLAAVERRLPDLRGHGVTCIARCWNMATGSIAMPSGRQAGLCPTWCSWDDTFALLERVERGQYRLSAAGRDAVAQRAGAMP